MVSRSWKLECIGVWSMRCDGWEWRVIRGNLDGRQCVEIGEVLR